MIISIVIFLNQLYVFTLVVHISIYIYIYIFIYIYIYIYVCISFSSHFPMYIFYIILSADLFLEFCSFFRIVCIVNGCKIVVSYYIEIVLIYVTMCLHANVSVMRGLNRQSYSEIHQFEFTYY